MRLAAFLLRNSGRTVVLALLIGMISGASNAGLIAVITTVLHTGQLGVTSLLGSFVLLGVSMQISRLLSQFLLTRLAQGTAYELRCRLSRTILGVPLRQLEELGAPRLLALLTEDVEALANGLVNCPFVWSLGVTIIVCLIYLGWLSGMLLLIVMGFLVFGVGTYLLAMSKANRYFHLARETYNHMFSQFRSLLEGVKELKLHQHRRATFFADLLVPATATLRNQYVRGMTLYTVAGSWGESLFFLVVGLMLFALPYVPGVSTKTLMDAVLVLFYAMSPLSVILNILPVFSRANVALQQVEALESLLTPAPELQGPELGPKSRSLLAWEELELVHVTHSYYHEQTDGNFCLGPLDLRFHPGELVFLIGGNGSGKTTLAKLLVGLYLPESGEIRLDGAVIAEAQREDYRQLFSVVFSDFYLFEQLLGIVRDDLDALAHDYLSQLHLNHKVQVTDGVLSTTQLSQGQRKRLALLTAYLEDRPFYVFDEWAADQDPLFKELFYLRLLPELKTRGKTVLVITHDDKYFHLADRLIKLDYGKVDSEEFLAQSFASHGIPDMLSLGSG